MKLLKTLLCAVLAATVIFSSAVFAEAKTVKTKSVTMRCYTSDFRMFKKSESKTYKAKVTNNSEKNVTVKFVDCGTYYEIHVTALKKTGTKKPALTVYYKDSSGKKITVKKEKYTVTPMGSISFKDVNINTGMRKQVTLKNPFYKDYTFKYSKKGIVKINGDYFGERDNYTYPVDGLKKGTTTVSVYIKGVKKSVGSFKINVGYFPTKVYKKYRSFTLKYNGHGSSTYMSIGHVMLSDILYDTHKGSKYSVELPDEKVAATLKNGMIYSTGKGKTAAVIYEKPKKGKKKQIATVNITVKKAKMADVAVENSYFYNDGIFGNGEMVEYLYLDEDYRLSMEGTINSCLINNPHTGSHFKKSAYKITYKSRNSKIASVSKTGVVTPKKTGSTYIYYTITFSDKSKFTGECAVAVWESEDV